MARYIPLTQLSTNSEPPTNRPRHYSAEIAALETLQERREALSRVPQDYRPMVETYLLNWWLLQAHKRKSGG